MPRKNNIEFDDPPKDGPITELFAFIVHDETGDGIMAAGIAGAMMPLVVSKRSVAVSICKMAKTAARAQGKHVKLVRFTNREDMEDIN